MLILRIIIEINLVDRSNMKYLKQSGLVLKTIAWGGLTLGFTFIGSSWTILFFYNLIKARNPYKSGSLRRKIEIMKRIFYMCFSFALGTTGTLISYKKTLHYASLVK
jgi:hypothetical protein